ncbi:tetratricopeptide repeat-containing glycosyltransferase family 2 protein [Mesobacillus foraminis]|uniref:Glycosyltransferase involved in cell wall biosynthesis n=1 Tax=Mesobacillus foraminis TaxID=279826 RepID=A0A4R2B9N6_9BACI|nr:glycosyltransferase family 2 protein [Mesobacillus foraminis]TCN22299.1 glycosyltransferase involved in cell wall biosynthesis [Mesobacillus foraminis]
MITISLCMIVKNEEGTIERCLESVKGIVDEIIIVDTGSTDRTKEIVAQYTDHVVDFCWVDDFAAARNFAFSHAKMDYIFWLDADDVLMEEDRKKFLELKETLNPATDSVTMHYYLAFDEKGNVTTSLRRNRLVKKNNNFKWYGEVHEYLEVWGKILHSEIAVTHCSIHHDSDRNLRIYENRLKRGEQFSARDLFYFANELFDHQKIERAIIFYKQFLATKNGWIEDYISACGKLSDCFNTLGDHQSELQYILKSFEYDSPRADFCCRLGFRFLQQNQPRKALVWYKLATELEKPADNLGMINHACWTWLPHLQLCVCYSQLENYELAYKHNEIARQYLPDHPSILHNKRFLEPLLK